MRVRYPITVALASLLVIAAGAYADTGFVATLSGVCENPANASPATGTAFFVLNTAGTTISYNVTYSGLTTPRTASHIHAASCCGVNSGIQLPIAAAGPTADNIVGSGPVNATLLAALTSSCVGGTTQAYVNVHSTQFPGGEIRGQLVPDATPSTRHTWGRIKTLYR